VSGKRYRFLSEENMVKFKNNVPKYLDITMSCGDNPNNSHKLVTMPDFRLFIMGTSGSGVHSQLDKLKADLKLPVLNFKEDFLKINKMEKADRKKGRKLKNGFIEKDPIEDMDKADEGNKDEEGLDDDDDEEVLEEADDNEEEDEEEADSEFKHKCELDIMKRILPQNMQNTLMNMNWYFEEREAKRKPETDL